ncbi:acyl-CoA dehydrogenase C-terminal domain-containing protein [Simiduia curdlanivorans]|uniref:Acyl-CoA dehydrogenase C-terminal domain-containing protein n=1 Tax=Simiduia curdlanivorans TaxID=1492769 RepID=A0ABV8V649_9GAMM|nr:acyl-CoA dehydrogenase C-terminal domain-containing protein [Simiduia curdlanivorans]MDN3638692.1 acyl-CoA dehydrogenase C-terminal domain-containing protein [Simiduia curdlanivorans]
MEYQAPLKDFQFLLHSLLNFEQHCASLGLTEINRALADAILEEGARYASNVVAPLNSVGDEEEATFSGGKVSTPRGFAAAYKAYCDAGWAAMTGPEAFDGQGLPALLATPFHEMLMSANLAFRIYSGLTEGVVLALNAHGSESLKQTYLAKLVSGQWAGTMCLTEPHAGTDLALLRTSAKRGEDGSYSISGTKIFISGGEQDLSENIIHLVLARLTDAPAGVKGISLFLVPKILPTRNEENTVSCGAIEHKMGIKGAATCVMNFDAAEGYLVGQENQGLACMFTMMNDARFQVGLQGLGIAAQSYQGALRYARDRLQCRALSGTKHPELAADPIIMHGDVRRMLLTQKALVEGSRLLGLKTAMALDLEHRGASQAIRQQAGARVALLIPIVKAFFTDMSMEVSNLGVQIYGGHGYIREWGMEQLVRDGRITQLYEGTNGIQAQDLVKRKILADEGAALSELIQEISRDCVQYQANIELAPLAKSLHHWLDHWQKMASLMHTNSLENPDSLSLNACDFLHFSSYILLAWCWLQQAQTAHEDLASSDVDQDFLQGKIQCAHFYFERILPRCISLMQILLSNTRTTLTFQTSHF